MALGPAKYVIGPLGTAVVFDPMHSHADMALPGALSAGFVRVREDGSVLCFGSSTSLDLDARPEADARIIGRMLRGNPRGTYD